jgi:hypothetical protein
MSDTNYWLQRAKEEAVMAIKADHPAAAAAHQGLSVRYSAKAAIGIVDEQDTPKEKARHRGLVAALGQP